MTRYTERKPVWVIEDLEEGQLVAYGYATRRTRYFETREYARKIKRLSYPGGPLCCKEGYQIVLNGETVMLKTQEPKYAVKCDQGSAEHVVVNRQSGEAIPTDEPIFTLRAQDGFAAPAIGAYLLMIPNEKHREVVRKRYQDFIKFAVEHPERMKEPD